MNEAQTLSSHPSQPTTIYCPQCGQAMRVAPQHMDVAVVCPHCRQRLEPWRITSPEAIRNAQAPPPLPPRPGHAPYASTEVGYSWRNKWIAGALGILLGGFGVHRFYLGSTRIGLTQVLLSVCSLGFLYPAIAVWGFIEGILCFCGAIRDVDGLPLSG